MALDVQKGFVGVKINCISNIYQRLFALGVIRGPPDVPVNQELVPEARVMVPDVQKGFVGVKINCISNIYQSLFALGVIWGPPDGLVHQELDPEVPDVQKDFVSPKMIENSILAIKLFRNNINIFMQFTHSAFQTIKNDQKCPNHSKNEILLRIHI